MEVGRLDTLVDRVVEDAHDRIGLYLIRCAQFAADLEDSQLQLKSIKFN